MEILTSTETMVFHVKGIKSLSHLLLLFNPYMRFQPNVVDLRYILIYEFC